MSCLITLKRSEVPEYLHASELYLSFDPEETGDEISVPSNCMKRDLLIHNSADLVDLLLTMRYWILEKCSATVVVDALHFTSDSDFIRDMAKCIAEPVSHQPCDLSAKFGRVDFLDFFAQKANTLSMKTLMIAAENGHLDCLSYCYDALCRTGPCLLQLHDWRECIRKENFECLPFLVANGVSTAKLLDLSFEVCSAKCIKFLHDRLQMNCWTPLTMATAVRMGKRKLLEELNAMGCPWDESAPMAALNADKADCLLYLIKQRGIPDNDAFRNVNTSTCCYMTLELFRLRQEIAQIREAMAKIGKRKRRA